jgi:hypothetical protein
VTELHHKEVTAVFEGIDNRGIIRADGSLTLESLSDFVNERGASITAAKDLATIAAGAHENYGVLSAGGKDVIVGDTIASVQAEYRGNDVLMQAAHGMMHRQLHLEVPGDVVMISKEGDVRLLTSSGPTDGHYFDPCRIHAGGTVKISALAGGVDAPALDLMTNGGGGIYGRDYVRMNSQVAVVHHEEHHHGFMGFNSSSRSWVSLVEDDDDG